jgi:hypothetical protein
MNANRTRLAAGAALVAAALGLLSTTAVDQSVSANKNGHSVVATGSNR